MLVVLSPLAEGADRLVADVGLELGARLIAVLPLPRAEYEKDFEHPGEPAQSAASKAEFARLLEQAQRSVEVPLAAELTTEKMLHHRVARSKQYEAAGLYIARHSQVLLALWDGVDLGQRGGTSEVIRQRLTGLPPPATMADQLLVPLDSGPVCHILTPRQCNPTPDGQPFQWRMLYPMCGECDQLVDSEWRERLHLVECLNSQHAEPKAWREVRRRMLQFNKDARNLGQRAPETIQRSKVSLLPEEAAADLEGELQLLRLQYAAADALARNCQSRRRSIWKALCCFGVGAVVLLAASEHLMSDPAKQAILVALYLIAVLVSFCLLWKAEGWKPGEKVGVRCKHLDYRSLAEGLRVQFFWRLSGRKDEVVDHYLRKQRSELEWIRWIIRGWSLPTSTQTTTTQTAQSSMRLYETVLRHWVADQAAYFRCAQEVNRKKLVLFRKLSNVCFIVALTLTLMVLALHIAGWRASHAEKDKTQLANFHTPQNKGQSKDPLHFGAHVGAVLVATALALFGAFEVYSEKMALSEQEKQYAMMSRLFNRAEFLFRESLRQHREDELQMLIWELGRDALTENGDWVLLHRERPMELRL